MWTGLVRTFRSASNPNILLLFVFAGTLAYFATQPNDPVKAKVLTYLTQLDSNNRTALTKAGKFVSDNWTKIVGLITFAPTLFNLKPQYRTFSILAVALWVWLIPEASTFEYFIQSFLLRVFFFTTDINEQIFLILTGLAAFWGGYLHSGFSK